MFIAIVAMLVFFALLFGAEELGLRAGLRRASAEAPPSDAGTGVVEGGIFALLGLLLAFTFTSAASRFDARRHLIVEEANAIGTSFLRLDVLPAPDQGPLRDLYRTYVDLRLDTYRKFQVPEDYEEHIKKVDDMQAEIWSKTQAALAHDSHQQTAMLVLPPLNEMIDVAGSRKAAAKNHVSAVILALLLSISVLSAALAGFAMARGRARSMFHQIAFALVLTLTVYAIVDLEYPRYGLINLQGDDAALVDVRKSMK